MRKIFLVFFITALCTHGTSLAQDESSEYILKHLRKSSKEGYRETTWGMTKDEVKKVLTNKSTHFSESIEGIHVITRIVGLKADVQYYFFKGYLRRVYLTFADPIKGVLHFSDLNEKLTLKYGAPKKEESETGKSVVLIKNTATFETKESEIYLYYMLLEDVQMFGITYTSKEMEKYEAVLERSKHADDLSAL